MKGIPKITIQRVFIAILTVFAGIWIWATVMLSRQTKADEVFYAEHVAPNIERSKRQSDAWQQARQDREHGKLTPFPSIEPFDTEPIRESIERMKQRYHYANVRSLGQLGFMVTAFAWICAMQIELIVRRRQRESSDRPADSDAGKHIAELIQASRTFVAKESDSCPASEVHVDGGRALVVFQHFTFITSFIGNPVRERVEMPFSEILAGYIDYAKGRAFLQLRTTFGKVMISERIQPFPELAALLLDLAELNRTAPDRYRAALAREPVVHTPWYGWLMIAAALGGVGEVFWWVLQH